jgi:hypothetical protein
MFDWGIKCEPFLRFCLPSSMNLLGWPCTLWLPCGCRSGCLCFDYLSSSGYNSRYFNTLRLDLMVFLLTCLPLK